jgi:hypothetical protein
MVKAEKMDAAKRSLRQVGIKNAQAGEKRPRQKAKSPAVSGINVAAREESKHRQVVGHSPKQNAAETVRMDSKLGRMVALLRGEDGATIGQMMKTTSWQAHSVRGAMSGAIKKRLGLTFISTKLGTGRIYRLAGGRR